MRRLARSTLALLVLAGWMPACGSLDPAGAGNAGGAAGSGHGGSPSRQLEYLTELGTAQDYADLSGEGAEVKYLAVVDGTEAPAVFQGSACLFQNTHKYPYHLQFLRTFDAYAELSPERYVDLVLRRASRVMWGGGLKLFAATPHPHTGVPGVLAYTVYADSAPSEVLTVEDLVEVDGRLKAATPFAAEWLVLTPDGSAQARAFAALAPDLATRGVAMVEPAALRPDLRAESYSEGEGFGYLRILTDGEELEGIGPRDVLVLETAPNELGLVAGLVTANPQSVASHLNLRLQEKGIPNAAVPGIFDNVVVRGLAERLVRVTARDSQVELEPARLEDAEAFWRARQPPLGAPPAELTTGALTPLSELRASDAAAFGRKAANLGELSTLLPAENRVEGFAIPLRAYHDFMREQALTEEVERLLDDPELRTNAESKRAALSELRDRIRDSELLPEFREALAAAIHAAYGDAGFVTRLRFRSSTNAEDLPGVSGAGLYDSRSGCLADDLDADSAGPSACLTAEDEAYLRAELERRNRELAEHPERTFLLDIIEDLEEDLSEEKSAYRAVRRVWASLWNERAFDDREYYGIDHRATYMGIAVHPTFVGEQLEAVVLTELEPDAAEPLYRVVSQIGEVGVVSPSEPGAVPEIISFRRSEASLPVEITWVQPSSLSPASRLWSDAALEDLALLLFGIQDHFALEVYPELEPLSLDLEVDVTRDGRTVIKQVRPFVR